jgi:hypothetical protein
MIEKKVIFQHYDPKKKYDSTKYKINVAVLQELLNLLKRPGYQSLIPSIFDTLKKVSPQELTPSEYQKLILSTLERVSTVDPHITEDNSDKEESVCSEPPTEDTHTSFINSSSSEQVAETTAPTQQARSSAEPATSAPAPRTPTSPPVSPTGVRGVFPQDTNRVGPPMADNKAQVNRELALHQKWAKAYLKDGTTKEVLLKALALRQQWLAEYGTYGDTKWGDEALIWLAEQENGSWENVQKVYQLVPGETVTLEHIKNNWHRLNGRKKARSPSSTSSTSISSNDESNQERKERNERNERNLQKLLDRAAAKRAAETPPR